MIHAYTLDHKTFSIRVYEFPAVDELREHDMCSLFVSLHGVRGLREPISYEQLTALGYRISATTVRVAITDKGKTTTFGRGWAHQRLTEVNK